VPFAAWLGRLVHLACLRVRRARRRRREVPMPDATAPQPSPSEPLSAEALRGALGALPERYRAPIELHYFGGLDYRSAAAALGLSSSAFGVRLHRGRELLRAQLTRAGSAADASLVAAALASQPAPGATPAVHGAVASLAHTPTAALPATTIPLGFIAGGAALMAAHPVVATVLAAALLAGGVATPMAMRAEDGADAPPAPRPPPRDATAEIGVNLRQLAAWQSGDGSWNTADFAARGLALPQQPPVRTSALAMLCFLGAGYDEVTPNAHHELMRRAMAWLLAQQRPDGSFSDVLADDARIATTLFEAYAMTGDQALLEPARRCVAELLGRRRRVGGRLVWTVPSTEGEVVAVRTLKWCQFAASSALAGQVPGADPDARGELGRWVRATWAAANPDVSKPARFPARVSVADGLRVGGDDAVAAALDVAAFGGIHRPDPLIDHLLGALGDLTTMSQEDLESAATAVFQYQGRDDGAERQRAIRAAMTAATKTDPISGTAFPVLVDEILVRYAQVGAGKPGAQPSLSVEPTTMPLPRSFAQ
jgi:hypothetical protein